MKIHHTDFLCNRVGTCEWYHLSFLRIATANHARKVICHSFRLTFNYSTKSVQPLGCVMCPLTRSFNSETPTNARSGAYLHLCLAARASIRGRSSAYIKLSWGLVYANPLCSCHDGRERSQERSSAHPIRPVLDICFARRRILASKKLLGP